MKTIFCYGTLQEPSVQLDLIGRVVNGKLTYISDYVVLCDYIDVEDGIEYPRIVHRDKGRVYGRMLEFTEDEVKILDEYETEMYRLENIVTGTGEKVWVYMPTTIF